MKCDNTSKTVTFDLIHLLCTAKDKKCTKQYIREIFIVSLCFLF